MTWRQCDSFQSWKTRALGHPWLLAGFIACWIVGVASGFAILSDYDARPASAKSTPAAWPTQSRLHRNPGQQTLITFIHPRCPCSRAGIAELERILEKAGPVNAQVVFAIPNGAPNDWGQTELWRSAERLPGVNLVRDVAGEEAQIFDVTTSGHTLLYDPQGRVLFSGGITAGRGHYGANSASDTLIALLGGALAESSVSQVFGCPLNDQPCCKAKP